MMRANDAFLRWCYRSGRPNGLAAALNRVGAVLSSAGLWPSRMATLQVRGRRSGRPLSLPVVLVEQDGDRYLVAMLGEATNWVANVRADGRRAVLGHGRREAVRLEEVEPGSRAPILRRYLQVAPGARPHIPVDRRAPLADFERIAERMCRTQGVRDAAVVPLEGGMAVAVRLAADDATAALQRARRLAISSARYAGFGQATVRRTRVISTHGAGTA